jgi:hypothetical protein
LPLLVFEPLPLVPKSPSEALFEIVPAEADEEVAVSGSPKQAVSTEPTEKESGEDWRWLVPRPFPTDPTWGLYVTRRYRQ